METSKPEGLPMKRAVFASSRVSQGSLGDRGYYSVLISGSERSILNGLTAADDINFLLLFLSSSVILTIQIRLLNS